MALAPDAGVGRDGEDLSGVRRGGGDVTAGEESGTDRGVRTVLHFNRRLGCAQRGNQFAGGFDDGAVRRKTVITYADGSRKKPLNYILFIKYPKLKPGAIVEVPSKSILKRKPLGEGLDKNLFRFFMISTLAATVKSLLK